MENTWWVRIYLSGPLPVIEQACREFCPTVNLCGAKLCVTVEPTRFIYPGGEETGAVVGLINYPRFPCPNNDLNECGRKLALFLLDATFQNSVLVMNPLETEWISKKVP